jgi:isoleucyl-tRNA synthetase
VKEKGWYVVEGSFVTTDSGSGIVHMAPAYGEDDYQTCRKYGLPTIHPVNKSGEFEDAVTDFKGKFVKDVDADIIQNLKNATSSIKKNNIFTVIRTAGAARRRCCITRAHRGISARPNTHNG